MTSALVSPQRLATLLGQGKDLVVVDASVILPAPRFDGDYSWESGRERWLAARVPLSIHIDLGRELSDPSASYHFAHRDAQGLATALAARGIGKKTHVVAYDHGDHIWAARLWWLLKWIGVEASVLDGGLPAWSQHHLVDLGGAPRPLTPAVPWTVENPSNAWASADDVAAIVRGEATATLVCGLGADAFAGTAPTRYSRRGHIPGSVNVPAREHVGSDGRLKALSGLRADWAALPRGPVVLYCGGGISAALSALTLHEIGITNVRLYDGSLEEWSADASRPLEVDAAARPALARH